MINTNRLRIALVENGAMFALVALVIVLSLLSPRFLSGANVETIGTQVVELGLVALPLALLVMSGTIDLSVGSIASLSAVTCAMTAQATGDTWMAIAVGILTGLALGAINGVLIAFAGLNALVVTLGMMSVWGGIALFLTGGTPITDFPDSFKALGKLSLGPVPLQIVLLIAAIAGAWYLLNKSSFGRQLLAVGGNRRAAHLMGINVRMVHMKLFLLSGASSALAGILLSMKLSAATPTIGDGMEFAALTVVLLGGVAFEGGSGRIAGVAAGLLFVGALRNGLVILGVSQFLQTVVIGITLVLAVSLDKSIQRFVKKAWSRVGKETAQRADDKTPQPAGV